MKQHKFNWVDVLVTLVVVVLLAGTALKFLVLDKTALESDTQTFTYELKIYGIRQYTLDALQVGDTVYDNAGKGSVGIITDIQAQQAQSTASYPDGTVIKAPVEDRYDVVLTLEAQGTQTDGCIQVGTYDIKANQDNLYFTKYSIWSAKVLSISEVAP
jgi:hypothetical protein